jgi:hypothetical protein
MHQNNVIDMSKYFLNLQEKEVAKEKRIARRYHWQRACDALETLSGAVIAVCVCVCTFTLFAVL